MVYQGTVLGQQLWNLFFEDAYKTIREYWFEEVVFADDLNALRIVPSSISAETAMKSMGAPQMGRCKPGCF